MRIYASFKSMLLLVFFGLCLLVYYEAEEPKTEMTVREDYLPTNWSLTREMQEQILHRKEHLQKMCKNHGLDHLFPANQQNTHEFLVNGEHGLIWCNVFKAASSTWFWYFNHLAGYSEEELLQNIERPMVLARRKYPRLSPSEVESARSRNPQSITFMIARHPFHRLVSAYRNKILSNDKSYGFLRREIINKHPELSSKLWITPIFHIKQTMPTFSQFVQYLIDHRANHSSFDIHWRSMNDLCSPCLNHFDMIAKVETLRDDSNYIIFTSGTANLIKPKIINQASGKKSEELANDLLCQLTSNQISNLSKIYELDLQLFDYNIDYYNSCSKMNTLPVA